MSNKSKTSRKSTAVFLITVLLGIYPALTQKTFARYSGGTGEPNDPYRIATPEDLNDIGNHTEDWNKHFVLVNDVNLAQYTGTQFRIIGNFTGIFDGNDHKICNFTWTSTGRNYIGLFSYVSIGGQIKNLKMENVNVKATKGYYVGRLVGANSGSITNCYPSGNVSGGSDVGGLVGSNSGTITNCYSTGIVSGSLKRIGGLAGNNSGTVTNCYSSGTVSGSYIGGLVGENGGTITNSYSTVIVSGGSYVGGLVGRNWGGAITNCYSSASAAGDRVVGGLVGLNYNGTIANCYSIGNVKGNYNVGGLIGYGRGALNSFWNIETSGQLKSAGGKGKTTSEMKRVSTYFSWGTCGSEEIWTIDDGNDYPRLSWEGKPGQPLSKYQLSDFLQGSGTENDPYLISTAQELNLIGLFPCEWDKHYVLAADVNLADYGGTQFNVIGAGPTASFRGVFDGNDHKIWNFVWTSDCIGYVGVFGCVGSGGQIKKLGVENFNVKATNADYVSGLVAYSYGTITNCYSTGVISGTETVGGLAGYNGGSISSCYSAASVSGNYIVGGMVGENYGGTITSCYSSGIVSGGSDVGGLVGYNAGTINSCYSSASASGGYDVGGLVGENWATIINCYATANISSTADWVGGLVGYNFGTITNCYSSGTISGDEEVGGLVGENYEGTITNCYSIASVSGTYCIGGLLGQNGGGSVIPEDPPIVPGWVYNSYSTGTVSGNWGVGGLVGLNFGGMIADSYAIGNILATGIAGGLVGECLEGEAKDSFWDIETSGQSKSAGGTGKTTAEMKTKSTFTSVGWDFLHIWDIIEGYTYPLLRIQKKYSGGIGAPDDPYRIATPQDLNDIGNHIEDWDEHFILTNDVNLAEFTGTQFRIIGRWIDWGDPNNKPFTGVFDGNNHKICNFTWASDSKDCVGLFGFVGPSGHINNIGMENVDVNNIGRYDAGGLVGWNYQGTITNCYSTGTVSGYEDVGGLVGLNYNGVITNCYSATNASGTTYVGGLVGYNWQGIINSCYSTGSVSGSSHIGGLVGYGGGVSNSFWDTETSGQPNSAGGTPKTTAEMKTRSTFTNAGWDFVGETINGPNDIWRMCIDGIQYPLLGWQFITGDFACPDGVDFIDFASISSAWLSQSGEPDWNPACDISEPKDNIIDELDLAIFCENWLVEKK